MSDMSERTCPICGHTFETVKQRDAHVPCPEPGDERNAARRREQQGR